MIEKTEPVLFIEAREIDRVLYLFLADCQRGKEAKEPLKANPLKYIEEAKEDENYTNEQLLSFLRGEYAFKSEIVFDALYKLSEKSKMLPRTLYKYKGELNHFPDNQLFLSDYSSLNDPFECFAYSKMNEKYGFHYFPRLLCLAQSHKSSFMWSMYGGGGKGRCVAYKHSDIKEAIKTKEVKQSRFPSIVFFGPKHIRYKSSSKIIESANSICDVRNALYAMFEKPNTFANEKEFRFVALKDSFSDVNPMLYVNPIRTYYTKIAMPLKIKIIPIEKLK